MFEIGFAELLLLGAIALLVVGPDRLPALARTLGVWVGRAQRLVGQVRADIEREVRADEIRRAAKEYSPTAALSDMKKEMDDFASEVSKPVDVDADESRSKKPEKAEGAGSAAGKPAGENAESGAPEAGKPDSSEGGTAGAKEAADPAATEPQADAAGPEAADAADPEAAGSLGLEEPGTAGSPAEDPSPPETAADAGPETAEAAADGDPSRRGTDSTPAPVMTASAKTPPAESDERSAAA